VMRIPAPSMAFIPFSVAFNTDVFGCIHTNIHAQHVCVCACVCVCECMCMCMYVCVCVCVCVYCGSWKRSVCCVSVSVYEVLGDEEGSCVWVFRFARHSRSIWRAWGRFALDNYFLLRHTVPKREPHIMRERGAGGREAESDTTEKESESKRRERERKNRDRERERERERESEREQGRENTWRRVPEAQKRCGRIP
jgi:hypothetical protein